jgi:hypothetical protein
LGKVTAESHREIQGSWRCRDKCVHVFINVVRCAFYPGVQRQLQKGCNYPAHHWTSGRTLFTTAASNSWVFLRAVEKRSEVPTPLHYRAKRRE